MMMGEVGFYRVRLKGLFVGTSYQNREKAIDKARSFGETRGGIKKGSVVWLSTSGREIKARQVWPELYDFCKPLDA